MKWFAMDTAIGLIRNKTFFLKEMNGAIRKTYTLSVGNRDRLWELNASFPQWLPLSIEYNNPQ
jgi:hypothetical protein